MKYEELMKVAENFDSYMEVLCKAILLDKVEWTADRQIKVDSWE